MKKDKVSSYKTILLVLMIFIFPGLFLQSHSQDQKYHPKGNPEKWNFELTPFFVLPWVDGEIASERLSKDYAISASDFINTLNFTFMITAEVSKGKFFAAPTYLYNYNEVEQVLWTSENGSQSITFNPEYQRHIFELIAGIRFRLASQFYLDPYAGFRYTHYRLFGSLEGIASLMRRLTSGIRLSDSKHITILTPGYRSSLRQTSAALVPDRN
jgi:hypothetical protein